jgi:hypothetical protein
MTWATSDIDRKRERNQAIAISFGIFLGFLFVLYKKQTKTTIYKTTKKPKNRAIARKVCCF